MTFFLVGTAKFVVLSICSFGIYPIYWTYQNWRRIRDGGQPNSPFWRACFAPFWAIAMLRIIKRQAVHEGISVPWSPVVLGGAFLIVCLLALLPDPWWLLSLGMFAPLIPVVATCRDLNNTVDSPEDLNETLSGANWATIAIGGLLLVLVVGTLS